MIKDVTANLLYKYCTNGRRSAQKHPETLCYNPYRTTTYAELGRFVIGRSAVQVQSSLHSSSPLPTVPLIFSSNFFTASTATADAVLM